MSKNKLNRAIGLIEPSMTIAISAKTKEMRASGIDIIAFSAGEPDFDTPDNIKEAGIKAIRDGFTKYTAAGGVNELKDAIIAKEKRHNNLVYNRDQICISNGAKHSLYNIAAVMLEKGDEVIIPAPYWLTYEAIVKFVGSTPVIVKTEEKDNFVLNKDKLLAAISDKTKMLILNNPNNPAGVTYEKEDLEFLADVARKHDLWIVADEVYEDIVFDGYKPISISSLSDDTYKRTLVVNSISKSYATTGWRIGYTCGDREIISAMTKLQSQSTSNPSSISQMAAIEALNGPQDSVEIMRREFEKRRNYTVSEMNSIENITCVNPKGAFYVFPNISAFYGKSYKGHKINNSMDFSMLLLEYAHIAVVPGLVFGDDNYIRVSFATSMENIIKGMKAFKDFVNQIE